ncbi:MAG: hypothetical protein ACREPM_05540, partial [Gemmatimonadaceae bacterium]
MRLRTIWRTRFAAVAALATSFVALTTLTAQQAPVSGPTRQLVSADLKGWKSIRQSVLSADGRWFAYVLAPNEGNATLVLRSTGTDAKETKFAIGEAGGGRGGAGGPPGADAGGAGASLSISGDSKWLAYTIYPQSTAGQGGRAGRGGNARGGAQQQGAAAAGPQQNKLGLVNIATGETKEFDRVRRFAFNGDKPTWIAMQSYPEAAPAGNGNAAAAPAAPA